MIKEGGLFRHRPMIRLKKKQEGKIDEIPRWLIKYSTAIVEEAMLKYYEPQYEKKRAEMLKQI